MVHILQIFFLLRRRYSERQNGEASHVWCIFGFKEWGHNLCICFLSSYAGQGRRSRSMKQANNLIWDTYLPHAVINGMDRNKAPGPEKHSNVDFKQTVFRGKHSNMWSHQWDRFLFLLRCWTCLTPAVLKSNNYRVGIHLKLLLRCVCVEFQAHYNASQIPFKWSSYFSGCSWPC